MASEQFSLCWDNFHKNMSSGMNSLLESEDLVDVTLAVQGKCLKAHKMVLSVCSPYFKELFKSNPCQHPIVFMKDVSYEALSDLLQFMYQGEVQVSQENLTTFIKTAEALQIKGLTADGNGSAENETSETHEKPQRHVEEYKPMPRPKKQPAPAVAPSPSIKRQRLSSDNQSTASIASTPITKQEPSASASVGSTSLSQPEQVHFKMEPYDQGSGILDETGDETFGDDTLDDTAVDDTEDYSMMESGVGESEGGEPQAGTSGTDGTGEGQDVEWFLETTKGLSSNGIVVGGFTYHQNITKGSSGTRYLICAEYKSLTCRARALIPPGGTADDLVLKKQHNHPPMEDVMIKKTFVNMLKKLIAEKTDMPLRDIYDLAVHWYPEGALVCPYVKMHPSMRRWRAFIYKAQEEMQKNAVQEGQ
ncbi:unnamed protein product [Acanthoscelides obtectus]|uniref:BTB domain-containing protein n=1 Tax=Acanthoscelides obtectus TaxID=200917 RepID=A0A9P0PVY9_ACAOB|nr:unnamed protein product [Acanthoscelides obtectus]CAK1676600.1 Modifier of mdg4 [Acanthoscelides obtectus]